MNCCNNPDTRFINRYKDLETHEYLTVTETLALEKEMQEAGFDSLSMCIENEGSFQFNPWYWRYYQNAMPSMNKVCRNCGEVELFDK